MISAGGRERHRDVQPRAGAVLPAELLIPLEPDISTPLAWHNKIYDHGRYSRRSQVTMTFLSLLKPVGSLAAGLSYVLAINFPFKTMNLYMK